MIGSPHEKYFNLLTTYASKYVLNQLELRFKTGDLTKNGDKFKVNNDHHWIVDKNSCNCVFRLSMKLPCRHIFKVREELGVSLYDESLCNKRWTRNFYYGTQRVFVNNESVGTGMSLFHYVIVSHTNLLND